MTKNISIQWKISGQLCFSAQALVAQKSWMTKNMHSISEFKPHSVFKAKCKLLKNPECKCIFNTVKNFRASISWSNILNDQKYFNTVKNFRSNLFFWASASCSKILNDKKYVTNAVNNFRENSVFQGKCTLFKNAVRWKNFQCNVFSVYSLLILSNYFSLSQCNESVRILIAMVTDVIKWHWKPTASKMSNSGLSK